MNVFEKICLLMVDNGFSFRSNKELDMAMGLNEISALNVINSLSEKNLKLSYFVDTKYFILKLYFI